MTYTNAITNIASKFADLAREAEERGNHSQAAALYKAALTVLGVCAPLAGSMGSAGELSGEAANDASVAISSYRGDLSRTWRSGTTGREPDGDG